MIKIIKEFKRIDIAISWGGQMNGFIICNKLSKKYGQFFRNQYLIVELQ